MPVIKRLRKWHFLLLGSTLVLIALFLWYWDWRTLGIPQPLRAEHFMTILVMTLGFVVLGIFIIRLSRRQVTIMLIGMVITNLAAALITLWINRTYPAFFDLLRPTAIEAYDPVYVTNWRILFLNPALYALHAGLMLLWAESLIMFFVRKPSDQPE
jgi:hypothetical protein